MRIFILVGAGAFGALVGWFVYYINRYRKSDVQFSDLTTLIGIIGGGSVMAIFDGGEKSTVTKQEMFGAYGLGLFIGFFAYFLVLIALVKKSGGAFTWTWFLDGRRRNPGEGEGYAGGTPPQQTAMSERIAVLEDRLRRKESL